MGVTLSECRRAACDSGNFGADTPKVRQLDGVALGELSRVKSNEAGIAECALPASLLLLSKMLRFSVSA
jgi:hypothetical protein